MSYIKLPTYVNFYNIAICPIAAPVTLCYIVDKEETISPNCDHDLTFLPFLPNHLYIMYCGKSREDRVIYFLSEQNLWEYVKPILGTDKIRFFTSDYSTTKESVPHLTPTIHYFEERNDKKPLQILG